MNFSYDLYISFSQTKQELPSNLSEEEWVSKFQSYLQLFLEKLLGRTPNIITSKDLHQGELSHVPVQEVFSKTAIHLSILSENFLESENCHADLRNFKNFVPQNVEETTIRQFVVKKSEIKSNKAPESLRPLFSYDFYDFDVKTREVLEYQIFSEDDDYKKYWLLLSDLAFDIYKSIEKLDKQKGGEKVEKQKTIFLAECSPDQRENRSKIKRELEHYYHIVLPEKPLSRKYSVLEDEVIEALTKCDISIHLIGESNGDQLEDKNTTIIEAQNHIAANYSMRFENSSENFNRVIWVSPDLKFLEEEQEIYIDQLKHDKEELAGAEIIQTPIEFLKTIVRNKLKMTDLSLTTPHSRKRISQQMVYVISDGYNNDTYREIEQELVLKGYAVEGGNVVEEASLIYEHRRKLSECDIAIILYEDENTFWLKMKCVDLLKAPGFGRKRPLKNKILLSKVKNPLNGIDINVQNLSVIESEIGISSTLLEGALSNLNEL